MSVSYRERQPHRARLLERINSGYVKSPFGIPAPLHDMQTYEVLGGLTYLGIGTR